MAIFSDRDLPVRFVPRYIKSDLYGYQGTGTFAVAGRVYLAPLTIQFKSVIDAILYHVWSPSAGNVRLCVYREGPTIDLPDGGDLVIESASVAQGPINYIQVVPIPTTIIQPGRYFVGIQGGDITGTFYRIYGDGSISRRYDLGAFGPFTDPCPPTVGTPFCPNFWLRARKY